MRNAQHPRYLVVGVEFQGRTLYRIERAADLRICCVDLGFRLDDGVPTPDFQHRIWSNADDAYAYVIRLEDGSAGKEGDLSICWVQDPVRAAWPFVPDVHAEDCGTPFYSAAALLAQ